jgi:CheY-like chemotaxis protein
MKDPAYTGILLVEDDEVDVIKVRRAFEKNKLSYPLYVTENGLEALRFLRDRQGGGAFPGIILLDLNTPKMNGIEFLKELRTDPQLRHLVVVVLTTSQDERDVVAAYGYNVAGYIVKPVSFQEFVDALSRINNYWSLCELPRVN